MHIQKKLVNELTWAERAKTMRLQTRRAPYSLIRDFVTAIALGKWTGDEKCKVGEDKIQ